MGKQPDFFKGGKVASKLNAWLLYFKENITRAGVNLGELNSPNGRMIYGYASGSGGLFNDYSLYDAGSGKLGIDNGTINGALPTGMSSGATRGSDIAYKTEVDTGNGVAYLIVTVNTSTGAITSRTIGTDSAVPSDVDGTGYQILGDFNKADSGKITIGSGNQGIGSQNFLYCGGFQYFWQA